jgi:shikimate dehydrogenase
MSFSGKALLAGVIGWPVGHSRSPRLHNYWLARYGIDGVYVPLAVQPDDLALVLKALPRMGFRGVNLTIPHKEAALALVDRLTPAAQAIGAVNTILVQPQGRLLGDCTDGQGFLANIQQNAPGWQAKQGPGVLIGAGGAASAIGWTLLAAGIPELRLVNRTQEKARKLASHLGPRCRPIAWEEREAALAGAQILINATSLGMTGQPQLDLDLGLLPERALVADIVYAPLETPLLAQARARGNLAVDGIGMLLHQGVPGFKAWFGQTPEVTPELRAHVLGEAGC